VSGGRTGLDIIVPAGAVPGDTIGVVAPAAAPDPQAIERAVAVLEGWGYRVELGRNVYRRHRYLAGTVEERLDDFQSMLAHPRVRTIVCARGGYGCVDLVARLDPSFVRAHPKLVCGYSDAAVLVNFLACFCGVASLHGPMAASEFARGMEESAAARFRALVEDPRAAWAENGLQVVRGGRASGPIVGGCLSSVVSLLGTPFAIATAGKVLFLEEVGEKAYRVERMLTQLRLAGYLSAPAAVILGSFTGPDDSGDEELLRSVVREAFAGARYPIVAGFPAGHESKHMSFAVGLPVEVDGSVGVVRSQGGAPELRGRRSGN